jgi:hypothetical protein
MNWTKIFANLGGVALGCLALQKSGLMGGSPDWGAVAGGVLMCVLANQIGLHQQKP